MANLVSEQRSPACDEASEQFRVPENEILDNRALDLKEMKMLGMIAAVLIVLWLLGFFAFHVTTGLIHIVLVVGLILLVLHLVRRA